jgi:hypothetical protein
MKILSKGKEDQLKKIKNDWEIAEIIFTSQNQTYDKDVAIRKLNAAIRDIFSVLGV